MYFPVARTLIVISTGLILLTACNPSSKGLFGKRSAHEKYSEGIIEAGLQRSQMGALWLSAADKSLTQPLAITLPFKETGYFAADKPRAVGYAFNAKRGEQISVTVTTVPTSGFLLFIELWQPAEGNTALKLLTAADTLSRELKFESERDGGYIIRLQPELLHGIEYTLTITTAPSLAFPLRESDKPRISSLWGADRDAGARRHEGIDIVAKFRSPVVAAADGAVTRVNENELGGKVVFMRPEGKNYSLYYAHLDSQIVRPGQQVKAGDVLGLLGNTGNARTTTPHLHFGIYTSNGAVDPFPFVNKDRAGPKPVTASLQYLNDYLRSQVAASIHSSPTAKSGVLLKTEPGQVLRVIAATENFYKVTMPGGNEGYIPGSALTNKALKKQNIITPTRLLDQPDAAAASMITIPSGTEVSVIGTHNDFNFIQYKELKGWVKK